ncbi:hypothetical protein B279_03525 [Streptococcus equinus ATCC 33317]|nr:hypothetical protein B279_03525 [Streptococcus equinus ATCC 33317]
MIRKKPNENQAFKLFPLQINLKHFLLRGRHGVL